MVDTAADEPVSVEGDSERAHLAAALAQLHPDQREVLLLHCWAELSHAEIAAALGIPPGTVASRLARARRRVRTSLGSRTWREPRPTTIGPSKEE